MKSRIYLFVCLALLVLASEARAQIKIESAYYGRVKPEQSIDVTKTVQLLVNSGKTTFHVAPGTFKLYPNPGRRNFLVVEYYAYGQKRVARAEDGDYIKIGGGSAPSRDSRVRFENGFGKTVYLYELSRWGSWDWKAQLDRGSVYTAVARAGDVWIVTDRNGRTLKQVRVPRELGTIRLY